MFSACQHSLGELNSESSRGRDVSAGLVDEEVAKSWLVRDLGSELPWKHSSEFWLTPLL